MALTGKSDHPIYLLDIIGLWFFMNSDTCHRDRDKVDPSRISFELDYILKFQPHCDRRLSKIADPKGKSVLVIGCGYGTEMLWCIRNGAKEILGLDSVDRDEEALKLGIRHFGIMEPPSFSMLKLPVEEAETLDRQFDLILSNNVFEHLPDVEKALNVSKRLVNPLHGRIAIFSDPLFYSSMGSHLPIEPWEHLWGNLEEIKSRVGQEPWRHYLELNRMTLGDFLKKIIKSELLILKLETIPDRNMKRLSEFTPGICNSVSWIDLTTEGIAVELAALGCRTAVERTPSE